MEGMVPYTQAAVERAMKVQEVVLRAMAKRSRGGKPRDPRDQRRADAALA